MGSASNQPGLFDGQNLTAASTLVPTPVQTEPAPREVVRCLECRLVQFRTASDHCRRCSKPLPSLIPFVDPAQAEADLAAPDFNASENDQPMDRAGRNRRVSIGAKMKDLREERHLTQVEMSEILGIPRSYLSRIENSRLLPGPMMVAKFAEALELDIAELLPLERRRDGMRLFPNEPALASLYTQIAKLPLVEMEKVLAIVRQMAAVNASPQRAGVVQPVLPRPAAPAKPQPGLKKPPASLRPQTTGLAIVPVPAKPARR